MKNAYSINIEPKRVRIIKYSLQVATIVTTRADRNFSPQS
jgi:hypothetical protein